ncbi:MAG TPA: calcium/proton exchanger [Rhodothermales bacterium]|nr:calcium/proton exchanger [Rhodothermales bacterium]
MVVNAFLLFVPISLALGYLFEVPPIWVFATAIVAIVPLAEWIRRGTEQMAHIAGSAIGGLLNVTFGNMAELVLALFVLMAGHQQVVKAQITGSIIGNGLLGLGVAILAGSIGRERQTFNRERAGILSSLFILAVVALLTPALFNYTERGVSGSATANLLDERLSLGVSVVLIVIYVANLVYTLVTHRDVYAAQDQGESRAAQASGSDNPSGHAEGHGHEQHWSLGAALGVLIGGTALIAAEAELVSGALEDAASLLGLSTFFLGVVVLAVIGNAAEYLSAVYFARQDDMSMVIGITVGSSIQIALFMAPVLVLVSFFLGHPMNLVFENPLELIAVAGVAFAVNAIALDGETNWLEGLMLLGVYAVLVLAFFFVTPPAS